MASGRYLFVERAAPSRPQSPTPVGCGAYPRGRGNWDRAHADHIADTHAHFVGQPDVLLFNDLCLVGPVMAWMGPPPRGHRDQPVGTIQVTDP